MSKYDRDFKKYLIEDGDGVSMTTSTENMASIKAGDEPPGSKKSLKKLKNKLKQIHVLSLNNK